LCKKSYKLETAWANSAKFTDTHDTREQFTSVAFLVRHLKTKIGKRCYRTKRVIEKEWLIRSRSGRPVFVGQRATTRVACVGADEGAAPRERENNQRIE